IGWSMLHVNCMQLIKFFFAVTRLKKLMEHVKKKHIIQVLTGDIQKMLKAIDVTWKIVTCIPCKWNEAVFLQKRQNYVLNRLTNIDSSFARHPLTGKPYDKSCWCNVSQGDDYVTFLFGFKITAPQNQSLTWKTTRFISGKTLIFFSDHNEEKNQRQNIREEENVVSGNGMTSSDLTRQNKKDLSNDGSVRCCERSLSNTQVKSCVLKHRTAFSQQHIIFFDQLDHIQSNGQMDSKEDNCFQQGDSRNQNPDMRSPHPDSFLKAAAADRAAGQRPIERTSFLAGRIHPTQPPPTEQHRGKHNKTLHLRTTEHHEVCLQAHHVFFGREV
ncbi:putative signal peptide protein, partial [Puccinia sorghi]